MPLTNNEKQIRHKKLETLKKYGNEVLVQLIFMNNGISRPIEKSNEEIKNEIDSIINLPNGWTDEDYNVAVQKIKNINITALSNPHLMNNDINYMGRILDSDFSSFEIRKIEYKAVEVVRNILSTLKLSDLSKSDQIATVAEVMRRLAVELLNEKNKPKTYANATALSLIDQNYEKPEWVYEMLAKNLIFQNGKDNVKKITKVLANTNIE